MLRKWQYDCLESARFISVMTEQDIDFESLPADIKDKLAELELELSEGKINIMIYQNIVQISKYFLLKGKKK